jgi:cellulose biosynthesis protein BcsQ
MKVISLVSAKGGVGKSCLSTLLAAMLSQKHKTALLDTDIQQTCLSAKEINPKLPYDVVSAPHLKEIISQGKRLKKDNFEWLIIDTNPRSFLENTQQIDEIIHVSDLCLLPCRPAPRDVRANLELSEKLIVKNTPSRIIWNFVRPRINVRRETMKQAPDLLGMKSLKSFIQLRACFQDVFDKPPLPIANKEAENEINSILKEIRSLVK